VRWLTFLCKLQILPQIVVRFYTELVIEHLETTVLNKVLYIMYYILIFALCCKLVWIFNCYLNVIDESLSMYSTSCYCRISSCCIRMTNQLVLGVVQRFSGKRIFVANVNNEHEVVVLILIDLQCFVGAGWAQWFVPFSIWCVVFQFTRLSHADSGWIDVSTVLWYFILHYDEPGMVLASFKWICTMVARIQLISSTMSALV